MTNRKQGNPWTTALEGLASSVRAVIDAQRRMAGATGTAGVGEAYVRFLRSELLPYGRTIADLTVDYYRALAEEARAYGGRFYDEVLGGDGVEEPTSADSGLDDAAIFLIGPSDSEIATVFTLENHDPTPAHVVMEAGVCRGPDGRHSAYRFRSNQPPSSSPPARPSRCGCDCASCPTCSRPASRTGCLCTCGAPGPRR